MHPCLIQAACLIEVATKTYFTVVPQYIGLLWYIFLPCTGLSVPVLTLTILLFYLSVLLQAAK